MGIGEKKTNARNRDTANGLVLWGNGCVSLPRIKVTVKPGGFSWCGRRENANYSGGRESFPERGVS